jgi:phosphoglycerate dehydrogenase-like enzyme
VIVTPHIGAHTDHATSEMGRRALADALAVLDGREPRHAVVPAPAEVAR